MRTAITAAIVLSALGLTACQSMGMGGSNASAATAMQKTGITQETNSNMATPQGAAAAQRATAAGQTSPQP